ncbi:4'-phosphopantetheinyl transferase superfamily protein [Luteimonas sp. SX5]|uniref:4'-phosphopantetheinyl transferase superfamily protein n=1 Tax=Luteimonas galliterrae TaxID=2940486 RepID=A0ABT0MJK6_9GAMM|nr:4'-phosphopantetheinyl transferase superfamily protein [Luteimonas galliterrae]MCL1635055.1 4'-phosphopantetheinyl transferase superfamily protein [Luteimonas galliterrae]
MSATDAGHAIGPIRWAWHPHPRTQPAEIAALHWLERRLGLARDTLPLVREARGRPRIQPPAGGYDASWSHSGEGLLVALGEGVEVGVDMEWRRARPRALELAQRYFAASETQWLASLPQAACEDVFLRLWCAKEAVLKADGYGLAFGLHRLAFVESDHGLTLGVCDPALGQPQDWHLHEFVPSLGYVAAIAWRSPPLNRSS